MSNQNPLLPQGSLLEQQAKGKSHLRVAYVIVALHLLFLGGLLIQGCKRDEQADAKSSTAATNDTSMPPLDQASLYSTNPAAMSSNAAAADLAQRASAAATNPAAQTSPSVPAEPAAPAMRDYTVVSGDSFYSIGKKFGVTASAIAKANPGKDSSRLKVGDKLHIPAAASTAAATGSGASSAAADAGAANVYQVKAGDTLGKIAKVHGVSVDDLKALNGLKTDRINVGLKLKLPPARASTNPAPAAATATPPGAAGGTSTPPTGNQP